MEVVKLTDKQLASLRPEPGRYSIHAESGLYLEVWPSGKKSWRLRFMQNRHRQRVNLGRFPDLSLAAARVERDKFIEGIRAGSSPVEERRKQKRDALRGQTVKEFAERYVREVVMKARKEATPIRRYLERDVYPAIGSLSIPPCNPTMCATLSLRSGIRGTDRRRWRFAICSNASGIMRLPVEWSRTIRCVQRR
jgi:hypothetical protein